MTITAISKLPLSILLNVKISMQYRVFKRILTLKLIRKRIEMIIQSYLKKTKLRKRAYYNATGNCYKYLK